MRWRLLPAVLLVAAAAWAQEAPAEAEPVAAEPAPPAPAAQDEVPAESRPRFRGALELLFASFPSGTSGGAQDLFANATPLLGFDGGDDFGLELGAELRLRLFDDPPAQRDDDIGKLLRRADWDQTSDFGQLVRELRIGAPGSPLTLWAGPAGAHSLGRGHLVHRYSNRDNPDYHPAAAGGIMQLGPIRTEVFFSDVLAARIMSGEVAADMGRIVSTNADTYDRYQLALSLAHDTGGAGYATPPISALHLDFDATLHRGERVQVFALAGLGSRILAPGADLGALVGLVVEGQPGALRLGGKAELRKQNGGFRHGLFGPGYELGRFSGQGLGGTPLADERLPDGFSGYGEFHLASGPQEPGPDGASHFSLSASGEHFSWGRTDLDVTVAVRTVGGRGLGSLRATVVGLGAVPRYALGGEVRYRLFPALYLAAQGATVFFPQPDASLVRGVFAGVGAGVDFER